MRRLKKTFALSIALLLIILCISSVWANASVTLNGYTYELTSYESAALIGWDNSSDVLDVPDSIGSYYVTEIPNSAFYGDDYIKTLELSNADHLWLIGKSAFYYSELEGELTIPTHVTTIGVSAFEGTNIEYLHFSSSGGTVPAQCFQYCNNLQTVVLTEYITTIERYAFYNCPNLSSVTIPRTVTSINNTAFSRDDNLVIYCYTDSYAQQYAVEKGIDYVLLDAPDPTEPPTEPEPTETPTEPVTEAPTTEPTQPVTEASGYYLGDVNGDKTANIIDATYIQRFLASLYYPAECVMSHGDVDGDGLTTILDVTQIRRYEVNIETPYPICEWVSE